MDEDPDAESYEERVTREALRKYDAGEFADSSEGSSTDEDGDYGRENEGTEERPKDCGDGVKKVTVTSGAGWELPKELWHVTCTYDVNNGQQRGTSTWTLDEKEAPHEALETAVKTMKMHESAKLEFPGGTATLTLDLVKPSPTKFELPEKQQQIEHAQSLKDNGNKWFQRKDLDRAKRRYRAAIMFADLCDITEHRNAARTNLAQVALLEKDFQECKDLCDRVLTSEPDNVKALYRRGVASMELEEYDVAVKDLKRALELESNSRVTQKTLKDCLARRKALRSTEKTKFSNLFTKLQGFASQDRPDPTQNNEEDDESNFRGVNVVNPTKEAKPRKHAPGTRVYLDIAKKKILLGRVVVELFEDTVPKTCENFKALCKGDKGLTYENSPFHRVIQNFMVQGGDITHGDGTGGTSIYGKYFDDEDLTERHAEAGLVSMANAGPNTNGSQFFVLTQPAPHLDEKHVVFGRVVRGMSIIHTVESVDTDANDKPTSPVFVANCGLLLDVEPTSGDKEAPPSAAAAVEDSSSRHGDDMEVDE